MNARTILNKVKHIESKILEHDPDIIMTTETWLHKDILDSEVTPKSYVMVRKDRDGRGGGVALVIRDITDFIILPVLVEIEAV